MFGPDVTSLMNVLKASRVRDRFRLYCLRFVERFFVFLIGFKGKGLVWHFCVFILSELDGVFVFVFWVCVVFLAVHACNYFCVSH